MKSFKALINNELITKNEKIISRSLITNNELLSVPSLTKEDIDKAYLAANKAFDLWRNEPLASRIQLFQKVIEIMCQREKEFLFLLENEIYKNTKDAKAEFDRTIDIINDSIYAIKNLAGQLLNGDGWGIQDKQAMFIREPLGVTLAIAPFNYPLNLAMTKLVPALLTGNTLVFKPASYSSGIGCLLGEVFLAAGFPKGVINVVTGRGSQIGDYLVSNKFIKLINFTGSTYVGDHIAKLAPNVIKIFELGGKDAALVLDDANLEATAKEIINGAFAYNGQRCTAIKRVLITPKTFEKLLPWLLKGIKKITIGLPKDNAFITPLIDKNIIEELYGWINDAKNLGAKVICGAKNNNATFEPTILTNVSVQAKIAWEEPFGPILPIIYCKDYDEMIQINNQSEYGLQASIFTKDINLAYQMAKKLEVGTVNINQASKRGPDHFPFLGVKNSGIGVQGINDVLYAYTRPKGIIFNFSK